MGVCIELIPMSSRKRGSNSAARRKAAATCVAKQTVLWPRTNALVGALYNRYTNEVQWPQGAPDSVKQNFAHVLAQALAPLHFSDREKTQPAIGDGSHAALQACHDSGHAAQPRGVTRSLSGSGEERRKCSMPETTCMGVDLSLIHI